MEIGSQGEARGEGSLRLNVGKNISALGSVAATVTAVKHPACANCGTANPRGNRRCLCGAELSPASVIRHETSIVANFDELVPLHARLLLWIGSMLRRLARRIGGV